jgi:MarR family transcriptional regulator for hemolysin
MPGQQRAEARTARTERTAEALAAEALVAVAPLATRWIERLLAANEPPLTTPQYLALRAIAREEQVSAGELARRAGVSGPAASQLLAVLVDGGLVDRRAADGDRRRQELALTPAGRELLAAVEATLSERIGSLLGDLPRPEVDALRRALPRVEAALSGAAPPRRPPPPRKPPPPRGDRRRDGAA